MPPSSTDDLRARLLTLVEPTRLLEEIFANAPVALQIYEPSGRCALVNAAFIELFGAAPPAEYNIFEDNLIAERGVADLIKRAFKGERMSIPTHSYDIRELRNLPPTMDTSGGRHIWIGAELMPLINEHGDVTHVLIAFNDQTLAHEAREDAERAARNAERARQTAELRAAHEGFLGKAARVLSSSLDLDVTLRMVAELAVESFADMCLIDLVAADGSMRRAAALHRDPAKQPLLDELQRFPVRPGSPQPAARALVVGEPLLLAEVDDETLAAHAPSAEHLAVIKRIGIRSGIACPLRVGNRIVGAISLAFTDAGRRYCEDDLPLFETLASHAAVAIENARLFRAVEQARSDAEAANRVKDEFLAMLGHELRNPLAPIVTALEVTREREGATHEREIIERQVNHLRRIVDDLLDVSRIARGGFELEKMSLELADAVDDGLELARPLLEQRHHEIMIEVPRGLPLHGDRVRLTQVVANLLINAARYTEPGGRITVTGARAGGDIILRIRDNGAGMSPELLRHVFETFTRGSRPIDRAAGGLGLGLAIVKAIAELHGGRVSARSDGPGLGSELEVVLPAQEGTVAAARRPTPMTIPAPPPGVRGTAVVLVVDDNADAAQLIGDALEMHGFRTVVATHPKAAIELAREHPPTIALVDIGLPDMDGYELAAHLRAANPKLQCVAITGFGQSTDRERSAAAGFAEHLVKPIKLPILVPLLDRLLTS